MDDAKAKTTTPSTSDAAQEPQKDIVEKDSSAAANETLSKDKSITASSSSLSSLNGGKSEKVRHRCMSGLYKRHSFGTKEDRKSTSVDNFLAATDYDHLRANRSRGSSDNVTAFSYHKDRSSKGKGLGGAMASAALSLKEPLMALRKLRPGVAAATSQSCDERDFADISAVGNKARRPESCKTRWLGKKKSTTTSKSGAHRAYRVGVGVTGEGSDDSDIKKKGNAETESLRIL